MQQRQIEEILRISQMAAVPPANAKKPAEEKFEIPEDSGMEIENPSEVIVSEAVPKKSRRELIFDLFHKMNLQPGYYEFESNIPDKILVVQVDRNHNVKFVETPKKMIELIRSKSIESQSEEHSKDQKQENSRTSKVKGKLNCAMKSQGSGLITSESTSDESASESKDTSSKPSISIPGNLIWEPSSKSKDSKASHLKSKTVFYGSISCIDIFLE
jgi:hypothetical protein